jgi:putative nucleotidyltransferase with HDIG domain
MRRWPYVAVATALVTGMPAAAATFLLPSGTALELLGGVVIAVLLSMGAAKLGAALWMRHPLARDVLFADLMVWEWARRLWVERRLASAQRALDSELAPQARAEALSDLARLLEARDAYTHGHSRRVARHALRIAHALHVPAAEAERIWTAARMHDVGKLYTPREILNKPGRLTDPEFEVIKRHPVDGADMLADVDGDPEMVAIVRSHHERLDGRGYPDGLAGNDIPLGARIIAVADTFDALTSTRSYRPAASHKRALDILRAEAGAQLDGDAVAAFLRTYSGRRPAALTSLVAVAALPARTTSLVASPAVSIRPKRAKAPAAVKAHGPPAHRGDSAPPAPSLTRPTPAPAPAPVTAAAPAPAASDEARSSPAPSLGQVVASAKAPPLPPVALPSVEPAVASVTQTVTEATSTVTATVDATVDDVTGLLPPK